MDGIDDGSCTGLAPGCGGGDSVEGSAYTSAGCRPLLRVGAAALGVNFFVWQLLLLLHAFGQLLYACELPLQVRTLFVKRLVSVCDKVKKEECLFIYKNFKHLLLNTFFKWSEILEHKTDRCYSLPRCVLLD